MHKASIFYVTGKRRCLASSCSSYSHEQTRPLCAFEAESPQDLSLLPNSLPSERSLNFLSDWGGIWAKGQVNLGLFIMVEPGDRVLQDYRKKLLKHKEVDVCLKELRIQLKELSKQYEKSEMI